MLKKLAVTGIVTSTLLGCSGSSGTGVSQIHPGDLVRAQRGQIPQQTQVVTTVARQSDACGASQLQQFVGGPSSATRTLNVPGTSRHYGRQETIATDMPRRLNFVHSGTAVESVTNPNSTVIRIFCG